MSTAWYKSNVVPKLLKQWSSPTLPPSSSRVANHAKNNGAAKTTGEQHARWRKRVQVWSTTCVVSNFGRQLRGLQSESVTTEDGDTADRDIAYEDTASSSLLSSSASPNNPLYLINPANPQLCGVTNFPYFPRGGPVPERQPSKDLHHIMGYVSSWGGMEAGEGMMFSSVVVDGLVHQMGGDVLQSEVRQLPTKPRAAAVEGGDVKCPQGHSVITSAGQPRSDLSQHYDAIVHTAPPFYGQRSAAPPHDLDTPGEGIGDNDNSVRSLLQSCYESSLHSALQHAEASTLETDQSIDVIIAAPLIGAGCRGFPVNVAAAVAAEAAMRWLASSEEQMEESGPVADAGATAYRSRGATLAFAIPSSEIQQILIDKMDDRLSLASII